MFRAEELPRAADKQRNVCPLPASIRMEFIQYQEPQALRCFDQLLLVDPRQNQLQHHVVREQDVRRFGNDCIALFVALLAGVPSERSRPLAIGIPELEELL